MPSFSPLFRQMRIRPSSRFARILLGSHLRHHLWRGHGVCGPARRTDRGRLDSHRGAVDQHSAGAWPRSILENNIVQTTGNAGQSIASGVIFTLPALVFLGFDLEYSRIFMLALIGGWLGVLFMIPLRRQLIVEEHGTLPYPEGTACADVLIAGEKGGSLASRVFLGPGPGRPVHASSRTRISSRRGRARRSTSPTSGRSTC